MDRYQKFSFLIAALAMACLFGVACDSGTQEPAAPDNAMPIAPGDAQSDTTPAPTQLPEGSTVDLPEEFPSEVPIYPGSVTSQGRGAVSEGVPMAAVQLQTSDAPEKVYDFYLNKFSSDGWTIEDHEGFEGKNAVSATNGKCTATMMAVLNEEGSTNIIVMTECS
jgi:hypothetical protein